jgi:DNA (cytosine-5)-methyltransferase 1
VTATEKAESPGPRVVSLFSGIAGIELGLATSGFQTELFCESWPPARAVLRRHFEGVPIEQDVRSLRSLPCADLLTAGFPCSDLSQAGRMAGIYGSQSGLVGEAFRLLRRSPVGTVLLENVRNMLSLQQGRAMRYLTAEFESLGYRWAYRVVDSRFAGVPQRRHRVIFLASRVIDPREVLHVDDAGEPDDDYYSDDLYGFYWTEGLRGLGWARDATPALKNGSTLGLASPPAIWDPDGELGRRIVTPHIEDAERLQGFPRGWTSAADNACDRKGTRWRLIGNAVTVGVARWVGRRLLTPKGAAPEGRQHDRRRPWPLAAYGAAGKVYSVDLSMWPTRYRYGHLSGVVDLDRAAPLSARATRGFHSRATRSALAFEPGFKEDVARHLAAISA